MNAEAAIKVSAFLPVLDNVIGFVEDALKAHDAAQQKIAQLTQELSSKDRVILEKVAQVNTPVFKEAEVKSTLDRLQLMNVIDDAMAQKIASDIKADPSAMLTLITKISEAAILSAASSEGEGIEKEAGSDGKDKDDPDGWFEPLPKSR